MRKCSFVVTKAPYLTVNEKNELKVTLSYKSGCRVLGGRVALHAYRHVGIGDIAVLSYDKNGVVRSIEVL